MIVCFTFVAAVILKEQGSIISNGGWLFLEGSSLSIGAPRSESGSYYRYHVGEKVGVCVLSSINSTLWPTRPSAHPLLLVFPLVLPSTLVAWQYFHSLRSGHRGLKVLQLTLPSSWAGTLFTSTHPIYQLTLARSCWSKPIFLPAYQLLPLIRQTADSQILHCQYDIISNMVWASALWSFHLNLEALQSRWCEISCYPLPKLLSSLMSLFMQPLLLNMRVYARAWKALPLVLTCNAVLHFIVKYSNWPHVGVTTEILQSWTIQGFFPINCITQLTH